MPATRRPIDAIFSERTSSSCVRRSSVERARRARVLRRSSSAVRRVTSCSSERLISVDERSLSLSARRISSKAKVRRPTSSASPDERDDRADEIALGHGVGAPLEVADRPRQIGGDEDDEAHRHRQQHEEEVDEDLHLRRQVGAAAAIAGQQQRDRAVVLLADVEARVGAGERVVVELHGAALEAVHERLARPRQRRRALLAAADGDRLRALVGRQVVDDGLVLHASPCGAFQRTGGVEHRRGSRRARAGATRRARAARRASSRGAARSRAG